MPDPKVFDLDVMRPDSVMVKLLDKQMDIGFVPASVAMEVEKVQNELIQLRAQRDSDEGELTDAEFTQQNLALMTRIVALVSQGVYTEEELLGGATVQQLDSAISLTFRHMYGPETAARIDEELAKAASGNGADPTKRPTRRKSTGTPEPAAKPGPKRSPSAESASDGDPITS